MATDPPKARITREGITDDVIEKLRTLGVEMSELARQFAAVNHIDHTAARALLSIVEAGRDGRAVSAGSLARELGLSSAAVTAVVDRLVESGHVRREVDAHDRRRVLLHLEPSARRLGPAYFGPLVTDLRSELAAFDDQELSTIHAFIVGAIRSVTAHREANTSRA